MPQSLFKALATLPKALPTLLIGLAAVLITIAGCSPKRSFINRVQLIDSVNFVFTGGNPRFPSNGIGTYSIYGDTLRLDYQSFEDAKGAYISIDSIPNTRPDSFQIITKRPWLVNHPPSDSTTYSIFATERELSKFIYHKGDITSALDTITLSKKTYLLYFADKITNRRYDTFISNNNYDYIVTFDEAFFNNNTKYGYTEFNQIIDSFNQKSLYDLLIYNNGKIKHLRYIQSINKKR